MADSMSESQDPDVSVTDIVSEATSEVGLIPPGGCLGEGGKKASQGPGSDLPRNFS